LNEKHTYFGVAALKIVTAFFSTEKYAGKPKAIAKYAEWATRSDGPGVWGTPTPIGCVVPEDHPDYVVRYGSSLQLLIAPNVHHFRNRKIYSNRHSSLNLLPLSSNGAKLHAMTMVTSKELSLWQLQAYVQFLSWFLARLNTILFQIERAFKMHLSGECVDVGKFSRELVSDMIDDYMANAEILSERRWAKLMGLCGAPIVKVQLPTPSAPSMQKKRRTLYIPSSPAKEE